MQKENIREYTSIKEEIMSIKNCITNYIGYVLGGTGTAVYALSSIGQAPAGYFGIAYTSLVLSVIISFVLLILLYKFNSHNRFVAYCKILSHERYDISEKGKVGQLLSWEITIEKLTYSDLKADLLIDLIRDIHVDDLEEDKLIFLLSDYTGKKPKKDRNRFIKGLKILMLSLIGRKIETQSWRFPPIIVAMFLLLCGGFLGVGLYETTVVVFRLSNIELIDKLILIIVAAFVVMAQIFLWWRFTGKLYALMEGSATVEGFFWRFIPIRAKFLNAYDITPKFLFANERLNVLIQKRETFAEAATKIQQLLKQLEQKKPIATRAEKIDYVNDGTTPSLKRRVVDALQAGGETAIEEFLDNPYVNVGKAIIKSWLKPE